ncbi:MAG: nuclear transport factor 2 family protein [Comamonadaceae bacterium]|nr:MAG: nuclear transport factor 2 family protein [Comamonadaceae bacterium]
MNTFVHGPAALAGHYIDTWNETDAERRTALLQAHWSEAAHYVDPMAQARGHAQIAELIGGVQQRYPGFRFRLKGVPDAHGTHLRFSWTLGPAGAEDLIEGTDFALIDGGRLGSVTGFLDKVPVGA